MTEMPLWTKYQALNSTTRILTPSFWFAHNNSNISSFVIDLVNFSKSWRTSSPSRTEFRSRGIIGCHWILLSTSEFEMLFQKIPDYCVKNLTSNKSVLMWQRQGRALENAWRLQSASVWQVSTTPELRVIANIRKQLMQS